MTTISRAWLFSVVVLCVVASVWFLHDESSSADSTNIDVVKNTKALKVDVAVKKNIAQLMQDKGIDAHIDKIFLETDKKHKLTPATCEDIQQQINSHPGVEEYHQFQQGLSAGLIDSYYEQLSMEELLTEAQAANVTAMRMLSRKHLWYAQFQSYNRPDKDLFSEKLKDRSALAKSRYWNEQAGLHGYVGAFFGFAFTYNIELSELKQQLTDSPEHDSEISEQIRELEYLMAAYMQLALNVMPQLTDILYPLQMLIQQLQAGGASGQVYDQREYEQIYQNVYVQWLDKRAQLGLPPQFEFPLTQDIEQLMKLEKQMFSCYR